MRDYLNAVRHTPPGSHVRARVGRDGADAVIAIEDDGPGVPDDLREKVFERFVRGSSAAGTEGLGLGLALVGEVARWHRGNVRAEDGSRGGALIRVSLPLAGAMCRSTFEVFSKLFKPPCDADFLPQRLPRLSEIGDHSLKSASALASARPE